MTEAYLAANKELIRARSLFPAFNSPHEGYAVLLEEVEELWEEVKKHSSKRDPHKMRTEAIQVAAMALRFAEDLCPGCEDFDCPGNCGFEHEETP